MAKLILKKPLLSKSGEFGQKALKSTKAIMSKKKNKYPLGVGISDLDNNLISKFKNNVELAKHLKRLLAS